MLLVGRRDGCIASIDMTSGEVLFKTEAHGSKGVIGILANVTDDQIISAGEGIFVMVVVDEANGDKKNVNTAQIFNG